MGIPNCSCPLAWSRTVTRVGCPAECRACLGIARFTGRARGIWTGTIAGTRVGCTGPGGSCSSTCRLGSVAGARLGRPRPGCRTTAGAGVEPTCTRSTGASARRARASPRRAGRPIMGIRIAGTSGTACTVVGLAGAFSPCSGTSAVMGRTRARLTAGAVMEPARCACVGSAGSGARTSFSADGLGSASGPGG